MIRKMLRESSKSSLIAMLAISYLFFGGPEFIVFLVKFNEENALDSQTLIKLVFVCFVCSTVFALLMWSTVVEPLRKKSGVTKSGK